MSGNFKYTAGLNSVGSYQVSSKPWVKTELRVPVSGAVTNALEVSFPEVTKFVTIRNDGVPESSSCVLKCAFSSEGLKDAVKNYFTIAESSSFSADFRITKLYLMASASADVDNGIMNATVIAGLTPISANHLTSSWSGSEGVDGVSRPRTDGSRGRDWYL